MLQNVNVIYHITLSLNFLQQLDRTITRLSIWMVPIPVVPHLIATVTSAVVAAVAVDRPAVVGEMAMEAVIVIAEVADVALVPAVDHHDRAEDVDRVIVIVWSAAHETRSVIVNMRENDERRDCQTLRRII